MSATQSFLPFSRPVSPATLIGGLFVVSSIAIFEIATYHGIGILPDSTRYMRMVDTPYDAPLYTWLLDMFRITDHSVVTGAELLGLALIAINTLLVWLILSSTTTLPVAILGTALIVASPHFISFHTVAMSEPLFISLVLVTALFFCGYFRRRNVSLLVLAGVTLGLMMLARFTAAAFALAIASCLLLDRRTPLNRRLLDVCVVASVSAAVFFTWIIRSELVRGQAVGRQIELNGNPDAKLWASGLDTLTSLLVPIGVPFGFRLFLLITLITICGVAVWGYSRRVLLHSQKGEVLTLERRPLILGLFVVFYFLFMIAAVHIEANLPLSGRYALPLYVAAVISAAIAAGGHYSMQSPRIRWALLALAAVVLASHVVRSADRVWRSHEAGIGYDTSAWHASPLVAFVKALPANAIVYSNGADALAFLTGRFVRFVPFRVDRRTGREDPENPLEAQIGSLRKSLQSEPTYVIFADAINWRFYVFEEKDLVKVVPLKTFAKFPDGRVYVSERRAS